MPMTAGQMEEAYANPETGSIRRRWLKRKLAGVVAVGETLLRPPPPSPPTRADIAAMQKHADETARQHRETVEGEIAALDRHTDELAHRIEMLESTSTASATLQELKAEKRQLVELRAMLEADLDGPILKDRAGRPIDDRDRAIVRMRAAELREAKWANAARCDAAGNRRDARRHRVDALRARQIAEYETGHRTSLPGYGLAAWS